MKLRATFSKYNNICAVTLLLVTKFEADSDCIYEISVHISKIAGAYKTTNKHARYFE